MKERKELVTEMRMIDIVARSHNRKLRKSLTDFWEELGGYDNTLAKKYFSQSKQEAAEEELKHSMAK